MRYEMSVPGEETILIDASDVLEAGSDIVLSGFRAAAALFRVSAVMGRGGRRAERRSLHGPHVLATPIYPSQANSRPVQAYVLDK